LIVEAPPTRQHSGMEETGPLQFGVEKSKMKWGTYFQDAMRTRGTASGQFEDYSGRGPSVVVQNAYGEKRILEVTKNVKEARARAAAIENDYKTLGPAQWCERYDMPASFLTEELQTQDMGKKVNIQVGGGAENQCRWSCMYCGTMGPWTSQTIAVVGGEAHGAQHRDEVHEEAQHRDEVHEEAQHRDEVHEEAQHRDEDLDEILQNMKIPIQSDPPPNAQST
jgi:hypothetical protein